MFTNASQEDDDTRQEMPPHHKQVKKYDQRPIAGNPTRTEAWALVEAAKRMTLSLTSHPNDEKKSKQERRQALRLNWRLWTIFQAELTTDRSEVPPELRINMLTLCKFIDKHMVAAMVKPTAEMMNVLIDINRNIAAGLVASLSNASASSVEVQQKQLAAPVEEPVEAEQSQNSAPSRLHIDAEI